MGLKNVMLLLTLLKGGFRQSVSLHSFGVGNRQFVRAIRHGVTIQGTQFGAEAGEEQEVVGLPTDLGSLEGRFVAQDREGFLFGSDRKTFRELGAREDICVALEHLGKSLPTSIQAKSFPAIMSGVDVIVAAETGSGKTYSYLIPMIQKCLENPARGTPGHINKYPSVIVLVPNKELCLQVNQMAQELTIALKEHQGTQVDVRTVNSVTGRWPFSRDGGPEILICTPSFLSRLVKGGHTTEPELFRAVRHLVLDEADMLLDGSYLRDVEIVISAFKFIRREMIGNGEIQVHETVQQRILSAATLPSYGLRSMEKYIESNFPRAVKISTLHLHKHHPCIDQTFKRISDETLISPERLEAIKLACNPEESTMIFVNTAEGAAQLSEALKNEGIDCAQFHKLSENRHEELQKFRQGSSKLIVCTDSAARGLDLPNVRHVIQAEFALNVVQHMHRIGRASRGGVSGRATSIYDSNSDLIVESIKSGIVSSFSRRRGLRKKWKKVNSGNL